jgi:hypothetical protein
MASIPAANPGYWCSGNVVQIMNGERHMPKLLVPEQFAEIARLSDEERSEDSTATTDSGFGERARARYVRERLGGTPTPRQALFEHLEALSDESFKELLGWVIFGRDYEPGEGDPSIALGHYIDAAVIYPRNLQEMYLQEKPIGKYLRAATHSLLTTTSRDIERAQRDEYDEDQQEEEY